jgi:hypothetical protein
MFYLLDDPRACMKARGKNEILTPELLWWSKPAYYQLKD